MRIVIPSFEAPDNFEENVAFTLRTMGHEVLTRGKRSASAFVSPITRHLEQLRGTVLPKALSSNERWLMRLAASTQIDIVLAITQALSEETLARIKQCGVRYCVAWWGDTPANFRKMGLMAEGWDAIFMKDRSAVAKLRGIGLNAQFLCEAMNPVWHKPLAQQQCEEIVIAGSLYDYRQFLIRKLLRANVHVGVYGPPAPLWSLPEVKAVHTGIYLVKEEKSRVFGRALACVNSSPANEWNSTNCRTFEIAGAGGLQLYEYRPAIEECFEPGKELLVFRDFEELIDLIRRLQRSPHEFKRIRDAGCRRAQAEHTYKHRLEVILRIVS